MVDGRGARIGGVDAACTRRRSQTCQQSTSTCAETRVARHRVDRQSRTGVEGPLRSIDADRDGAVLGQVVGLGTHQRGKKRVKPKNEDEGVPSGARPGPSWCRSSRRSWPRPRQSCRRSCHRPQCRGSRQAAPDQAPTSRTALRGHTSAPSAHAVCGPRQLGERAPRRHCRASRRRSPRRWNRSRRSAAWRARSACCRREPTATRCSRSRRTPCIAPSEHDVVISVFSY